MRMAGSANRLSSKLLTRRKPRVLFLSGELCLLLRLSTYAWGTKLALERRTVKWVGVDHGRGGRNGRGGDMGGAGVMGNIYGMPGGVVFVYEVMAAILLGWFEES